MGTVHRWYCIPDDIWLHSFKTASRASAFYGYNLLCKCISWLLWMFDRTGWSANSMVAPTYIVYINQFFMILTATSTTLGTLISLNNCTTSSAVWICSQPLTQPVSFLDCQFPHSKCFNDCTCAMVTQCTCAELSGLPISLSQEYFYFQMFSFRFNGCTCAVCAASSLWAAWTAASSTLDTFTTNSVPGVTTIVNGCTSAQHLLFELLGLPVPKCFICCTIELNSVHFSFNGCTSLWVGWTASSTFLLHCTMGKL